MHREAGFTVSCQPTCFICFLGTGMHAPRPRVRAGMSEETTIQNTKISSSSFRSLSFESYLSSKLWIFLTEFVSITCSPVIQLQFWSRGCWGGQVGCGGASGGGYWTETDEARRNWTVHELKAAMTMVGGKVAIPSGGVAGAWFQ
jgi:hypothetical protein